MVEISFVAALAVADAVDALLPRQVRATLKWPNDVLVRDGKIAGILLEQADDALVLGVGLNVLQAPVASPQRVHHRRLRRAGDGRRRARGCWQRWGTGSTSGSRMDSRRSARPGWRARIRQRTPRSAYTVADRHDRRTLRPTWRRVGALIIDTTRPPRICAAGDVGFAGRAGSLGDSCKAACGHGLAENANLTDSRNVWTTC